MYIGLFWHIHRAVLTVTRLEGKGAPRDPDANRPLLPYADANRPLLPYAYGSFDCCLLRAWRRLGGKGRGDHFVTIKVDSPTSVSSSDRELLMKLKEGATAGKGFFSK